VTILSPRPLSNPDGARAQLRSRVTSFEAFSIEIPNLQIFAETAVIYAEISTGKETLGRMHDNLNVDMLEHDETYIYHPHITLAQGLPADQVLERYDLAVRRWNESVPRRRTMIENLTFVQNTNANRWLDLDQFELRAALLI
jgi:2'-5' RNA ligase